jgi:hypothetical protein
MRRLIVQTLLWGCNLHDLLRLDYLAERHTLADWSARLDERWHTGVWETPQGDL